MKKLDIVREANVGTSIELTNVELVVIKSKWTQIKSRFDEMSRVDADLLQDVEHFNALMQKIIGTDILSLEETADDLFSREVIDDINDMELVGRASVSGYNDRESV